MFWSVHQIIFDIANIYNIIFFHILKPTINAVLPKLFKIVVKKIFVCKLEHEFTESYALLKVFSRKMSSSTDKSLHMLFERHKNDCSPYH